MDIGKLSPDFLCFLPPRLVRGCCQRLDHVCHGCQWKRQFIGVSWFQLLWSTLYASFLLPVCWKRSHKRAFFKSTDSWQFCRPIAWAKRCNLVQPLGSTVRHWITKTCKIHANGEIIFLVFSPNLKPTSEESLLQSDFFSPKLMKYFICFNWKKKKKKLLIILKHLIFFYYYLWSVIFLITSNFEGKGCFEIGNHILILKMLK